LIAGPGWSTRNGCLEYSVFKPALDDSAFDLREIGVLFGFRVSHNPFLPDMGGASAILRRLPSLTMGGTQERPIDRLDPHTAHGLPSHDWPDESEVVHIDRPFGGIAFNA
jgi:hypothetical protein